MSFMQASFFMCRQLTLLCLSTTPYSRTITFHAFAKHERSRDRQRYLRYSARVRETFGQSEKHDIQVCVVSVDNHE
jgi:hypothetical protein